MKDFLIKNKDGITTGLGIAQLAATTGYQTYQATMGQAGNGTAIIISIAMAVLSWFTGKQKTA